MNLSITGIIFTFLACFMEPSFHFTPIINVIFILALIACFYTGYGGLLSLPFVLYINIVSAFVFIEMPGIATAMGLSLCLVGLYQLRLLEQGGSYPVLLLYTALGCIILYLFFAPRYTYYGEPLNGKGGNYIRWSDAREIKKIKGEKALKIAALKNNLNGVCDIIPLNTPYEEEDELKTAAETDLNAALALYLKNPLKYSIYLKEGVKNGHLYSILVEAEAKNDYETLRNIAELTPVGLIYPLFKGVDKDYSSMIAFINELDDKDRAKIMKIDKAYPFGYYVYSMNRLYTEKNMSQKIYRDIHCNLYYLGCVNDDGGYVCYEHEDY